MFLTDSELLKMLQAENPIVSGVQLDQVASDSSESQVQPCSLDLRIGEVFKPGALPGKPGAAGTPRTAMELQAGQTAVITTSEECHLPANLAAIGFPPNSVSSRGILMTNPGHVDPGYDGKMTFTVINMGQEDYMLVAGEKIVTLLFFTLEPPASKDLRTRHDARPETSKVESLLSVLSADFLNISGRVRVAAATEEQKTRRMSLLVPILITVVAIISSTVLLRGEISDLKAQTSAFADYRKLETEIASLRTELAHVKPSSLQKSGNK
jgi:deoxycytidine triphosphate deaminase